MIMFSLDDDRAVDRLAPLLAAAIPAVGGLVASIFGSSSANSANAKQAELNRDFQERMSNTEMQRRVADLKAAGLNPAMAMASGQGATAPSGSVSAPQQNIAGGSAAFTSQMADAAVKAAQVRNIDAETAGKLISNTFLGPLMVANTAMSNSSAFRQGQEGFLTSENRAWLDRLNENALEVAKSAIMKNSATSALDISAAALNKASLPERRFRSRVAEDFDKALNSSAEGWRRIGQFAPGGAFWRR